MKSINQIFEETGLKDEMLAWQETYLDEEEPSSDAQGIIYETIALLRENDFDEMADELDSCSLDPEEILECMETVTI